MQTASCGFRAPSHRTGPQNVCIVLKSVLWAVLFTVKCQFMFATDKKKLTNAQYIINSLRV